jgi:hypothetical protein
LPKKKYDNKEERQDGSGYPSANIANGNHWEASCKNLIERQPGRNLSMGVTQPRF